MRGWDELGVVDTIYEDDDEHQQQEDADLTPSISASPISPQTQSSSSLLSPPPSLHERVDEWSATTGCKADVAIRLHDRCFHLHKEPLVSRSRYLCRRLTESTDVTVSPPPGITADIFAEVVIFCYDSFVNLTPANLAAVRIAADWLEMDADGGGGGGGSLTWRTENYFRQEIAGDAENAGHVLRACVRLLPDVTAALLAARCVDVLAREGADGGWMGELTALTADAFRVVAESMRTWFVHDHDLHDLLYRIVDYYIEKHREKLTEEEKSMICNTINCANLSHDRLLHLVQNPRLPLRFIVQAMLLDQLQTRHACLHLSTPSPDDRPASKRSSSASSAAGLTLGAILQRDSARRQASHLRASMHATSARIESLERDLDGLRTRLRWSEEKRAEVEAVRSSSFRVVRRQPKEAVVVGGMSCKGDGDRKGGKWFGRKVVDGLKSMFKVSPSSPASKGKIGSGGGGEKRLQLGHRRNHSFA